MSTDLNMIVAQAIVPFQLLKPPLYFKDARGKKQRCWAPGAAERARLRSIVYPRDSFTCQECGKKFEHPADYDGVKNIEGLSLGHIIDYRLGGPYVEENLVTECQGCNIGRAYMEPKGTPPRDRDSGRGDGAFGLLR